MDVHEELQDAYKKLDTAEKVIIRLRKEADDNYKVEQILIAAGFITQDKVSEARDILHGLDNQ